ncbi:MAG: SDR family oxidoreductase [Flavobacteriaceae bacterium]|nr:SDR family oxidoreductase [Flavobacteriaceae bacterium]
MGTLENKVIWITGASSGIGEELAYQLSQRSCRLILSARRVEELEKVREACQNPDQVAVLPLDIIAYDTMEAKVRQAIDTFGSIDILINNAGISQRSLIMETDFEVYRQMMEVNYFGTVALTKAVLPHFVSRKQGHFVVVSSLMGRFSSPYRSGYCGAKHALHGFFDALRLEHDAGQIDVTLVCPGFVQTEIAKNALTKDGSPQGADDGATQNGLPVAVFCKKMIRAIESARFEVYIGGKEVKGIFMKRFFPKKLHRLVLKSTVR